MTQPHSRFPDTRFLSALAIASLLAPLQGCDEPLNLCLSEDADERAECIAACRTEPNPPEECAPFLEDGGSSPCSPSCTAPTPHCNAPTGQCVECRTNNDCPIENPVCIDANTCIGCRNDTDCADRPDTPTCNPTSGSCTTCQTDTDCTDPSAARCDTDMGRCVPCTENTQCAGIEGAPVCNDGACVECTESDDSACEGRACNPATNTCSAFSTDRRRCESCEIDANCQDADHFCVPLNFMGAPRGGFCLQQVPETEPCPRPYRAVLEGLTSLSGVSGQSYCGIDQTTVSCEAITNFGTECKDDPNVCVGDGARCENVPGSQEICTYLCGGNELVCPSSTACRADFCGS